MIVFGEKPEYFSSTWIKNEWSRFLKLMAKDKEKRERRWLVPNKRAKSFAEERKKIKVSANDTISTVAVEQGISIEEFFLSNPEFTSINNIFYENQYLEI